MKVLATIMLAVLLWLPARAEVEVAQSFEDVTRFLELNQDDTVALLFIDSTLSEQAGNGFLSGVVSSVTHIFSGAEEPNASHQRVAEIEKEISDETALIQIDVSNENLREIQESYDVTTVPFLIVTKRGIVVLKEVPTHETHDKILQVLNVNPAAVHAEDGIVEVSTENNSEPISAATPESSAESGLEKNYAPVSFVETVEEEVPAVPEETAVEEPITVVEPITIEEPLVVEEPVIVEEPVVVEIVEPEVIPIEETTDDVIIINDVVPTIPEVNTPSITEPGKIYATEINPDDHSAVPRGFELPPRPLANQVIEPITLEQPESKPIVEAQPTPVVQPQPKPVIELKPIVEPKVVIKPAPTPAPVPQPKEEVTVVPIVVPQKITLAPGEKPSPAPVTNTTQTKPQQ